jgi:hypothetical protein
MNQFNWEQYLQNYPDLVIAGLSTKEECYNHYRKYGYRENRTDKPGVNINTTNGNLGGRFGNVLIYNIVLSFLAEKSNLKMTYKQQQETEKILDIKLYTGDKVFDSNYILTDQIIDEVFENTNSIKNKNLVIGGYFQKPVVARYIKSAIKPNPVTTDSIFVHVRLGDTIGLGVNENYDYYSTALSKLPRIGGFISSDTPDHEICKTLMVNYNLVSFTDTEVNTILFGSSCKYLVLSKGTFSWWMGVLSSGEVYYPESKKVWHGNIFVFPEWNKIIC